LLLIWKPSLVRTSPPHATKFSFTNCTTCSLHKLLSQNGGVFACSGEWHGIYYMMMLIWKVVGLRGVTIVEDDPISCAMPTMVSQRSF
jgi:hypothetical protein